MEFLYEADLSLFTGLSPVAGSPSSSVKKHGEDHQDNGRPELVRIPHGGDGELSVDQSLSPDLLGDSWLETKVDLLEFLTGDVSEPVASSGHQDDLLGCVAVADPVSEPSMSAVDLLENMVEETAQQLSSPSTSPSFQDASTHSSAEEFPVIELLDLLECGEESVDILPHDYAEALSPMSSEEVETILSSSPPSPCDQLNQSTSSAIDLSEFSDLLLPAGVEVTQVPLIDSQVTQVPLIDSQVTQPSHLDSQLPGDLVRLFESVEQSPVSSTDELSDADYFPALESSVGKQKSKRGKYRKKELSPAAMSAIMQEKKLRKKQQNKDAAIRYRMKKKQESEVIDVECSALEARNQELKGTVDSMTKEISYLKKLLAEIYLAKGKPFKF